LNADAALLCPGPSLATFRRRPEFEFLIGVNRAVLAHPCDWWVFGDAHVWDRYRPTPIPRVCTRAVLADRFGTHGMRWENLVEFCPAAWDWQAFSVTAALVLCSALGVKRLQVFGCDRTNAPDWDGVDSAPDTRHDHRWRREGRIWNRVAEHLAIEVSFAP
jgi:hypothetical protein